MAVSKKQIQKAIRQHLKNTKAAYKQHGVWSGQVKWLVKNAQRRAEAIPRHKLTVDSVLWVAGWLTQADRLAKAAFNAASIVSGEVPRRQHSSSSRGVVADSAQIDEIAANKLGLSLEDYQAKAAALKVT